jgi:hypothetical protein
MELYIYDRNLNFKGIIDNFTSFRWIRKYYKNGEFELHCDLTFDSLELLKKGNIIYKKDDAEAGFIEYRNLKQDIEGKELLTIKGKFLTGYFNRRIIWGTQIFNTTAENVMRSLVTEQCISPVNTDRIIPNLILGSNKGYINTVNFQVSYKNLLNELTNLSNTSNLGYRINFDTTNNKLVFDVYSGLDRSVNQTTNAKAIFSKEFDNILEQEYTDSINNYKNVALIGGIGVGTERKLATVGNTIGLDRYELFVDQNNLSNEVEGVPMSDTDYTNLLIEKGNSGLSETKEITTFNSKINLSSNLKYKVDFDLGDIVTCISKKWEIVLDSRITEIEEVYEEAGQRINVVFGNNIPTLIDKIKQKLI